MTGFPEGKLGKEAMAEPSLRFGPFSLFPSQRLLLKGAAPVRIGSRALDILIALVERRGSVIGKAELKSLVWPGLHVEDNNLTVHISALRKAFNGLGDDKRYIVSVPSRGYAFVAAAVEEGPSPESPSPLERSARRSHNLPYLLASLVGRSETVGMLEERVRRHRLLTIVGAGGVGKTSVALAVGQLAIRAFANGVWLVDLASVASDDLVVNTVAAVLGLEAKDADLLPVVLAALRDRRLLLILDNCEHVLDGVSRLVHGVLEHAPEVMVMTTSREPLRLEGENVFRLFPLECPPEDEIETDDLRRFPAVELFLVRASAGSAELEVPDEDLEAVAGICRRLDGIPLAIEFAAAYAGALGVPALGRHLEERLRLPKVRRNAALERHRTLQATQDWSYGLLSPGEQSIFRRLAVFAGKFPLDAAAAVASDDPDGFYEVADHLANLVAKSLVSVDVNSPNARYRLLHTTRAYALEKIREEGKDREIFARHAAYHADLLLKAWNGRGPLFERGGYGVFRDQVDDIRSALNWSFGPSGDLALAVTLAAGAGLCFVELALMTEAREWSQRGLEAARIHGASPQRLALLQYALTHALIVTRGNAKEAFEAIGRSLETSRAAGERDLEMRTLGGLHIFQSRTGNFEGAMEAALRAQEIAAPDDAEAVAMAAGMLALSYHYAGDQATADEYCRLSLRQVPLDRRVNAIRLGIDQRIRAQSVNARLLWLLGRPDQALDAVTAMHGFGVRSGDRVVEIMSLDYTVMIAILCGDWDRARQGARDMDQLAREILINPYPTLAAVYAAELRFRADGCGRIDDYEAAFDAISACGWSLSFLAIGFIDALTAAGRTTQARNLADETATRMERQGQRLYLPEYRRLLASILVKEGNLDGAARAFEEAIEMARAQSALAWELRSTTGLANLYHEADPSRARALLTPVLARFSEGFGSRDVREAQRLIAE